MGLECRFCQGTNLTKVLDLGKMPLAGGFLKEKDFENEKLYPLELYECQECGLVQVGQVPKEQKELFTNTLFRSSTSNVVVKHFKELAKELKDYKTVLEIGCNDGVLIKPLEELGVRAIGVDPCINDYFTEKLAIDLKSKYGQIDAIVSSYTFSHIDDVSDVMRGIKLLLKDEGTLIIESYFLDIDKLQYDMIYHEHAIYLSPRPMVKFLERFGMEIFDIKFMPEFRSGCMRYYIRNKKSWQDYNDKIEGIRSDLLNLLDKLKAEGKTIIGYGATGRGTVIMNYCGIDSKYIDYVVDDTPEKQEFYTPGTHVPIQTWDSEKDPDYVLLFAWAFADEIMAKHKDYKGKWIIPLPKVRVI